MSRTEVIALVAVVGLIAVAVVRQIGTSGERALVADMVSDLQSLALHQESYLRDSAVYSSDLLAVQSRGFTRSPRVRFEIHEATRTGWAATVSHDDIAIRCYLFVGEASPTGSASERGVVTCD